jgi:mannose-6-phosphate isomerase-like protein (cupin superfamily)
MATKIVAVPLGTCAPGEEVLRGEVAGLCVLCRSVDSGGDAAIPPREGCARVLLVLSGRGTAATGGRSFVMDGGASVLVPAPGETVTLHAESSLGALELQWRVTEAELGALTSGGATFFQRLADSPPYKEAIKSPKTTSRTLVPAGVVPRFAAGSVHTTGPDAVGAHSHPMLEQLFVGLEGSQQTVTADDLTAELLPGDVLHIPLGSMHGVTVGEGRTLSYLWLDFFPDAAGMSWLENHKDV